MEIIPQAIEDARTGAVYLFDGVHEETEGKPNALRRSQAFYDVLSRMTVYVNADELDCGKPGTVASKPSPDLSGVLYRLAGSRVKWFTFFSRIKDRVINFTTPRKTKTKY